MTSFTVPPTEAMRKSKIIAVVGASKNPEKEAHSVPRFLKDHGYKILPVNPTASEIFGERAYPDLMAIPPDIAKQVDVVEVFRPSEELPQVARSVVELSRKSGKRYVFWAQSGLESDEAKRILEEAGLPYVMDACMRVVYRSPPLLE